MATSEAKLKADFVSEVWKLNPVEPKTELFVVVLEENIELEMELIGQGLLVVVVLTETKGVAKVLVMDAEACVLMLLVILVESVDELVDDPFLC